MGHGFHGYVSHNQRLNVSEHTEAEVQLLSKYLAFSQGNPGTIQFTKFTHCAGAIVEEKMSYKK